MRVNEQIRERKKRYKAPVTVSALTKLVILSSMRALRYRNIDIAPSSQFSKRYGESRWRKKINSEAKYWEWVHRKTSSALKKALRKKGFSNAGDLLDMLLYTYVQNNKFI